MFLYQNINQAIQYRVSVVDTSHEIHKSNFMLGCEATGSTGNYMFFAQKAPISEVERYLNAGRFKHFKLTKQSHVVVLTYPNSDRKVETLLTEMLDWIGENVNETWSLDMSITELSPKGQFIMTFSFEEDKIALLFKLKFG